MSLTANERILMRLELTPSQRNCVDTAMDAVQEAFKNCGFAAAGDDRAAKVEAGLIRYLVDSEEPKPESGFDLMFNPNATEGT